MGREDRYKRIGKEVSINSDCHVQMSALLIRKGSVIAQGFNKRGYRASSLHAEIDALKQVVRQKHGAEGADMWLFRFGGYDGESTRMSKPCSKCIEAIYAAGVKRVFYYDWEGNLKVIKMNQVDSEDYYTIFRNASPCR